MLEKIGRYVDDRPTFVKLYQTTRFWQRTSRATRSLNYKRNIYETPISINVDACRICDIYMRYQHNENSVEQLKV